MSWFSQLLFKKIIFRVVLGLWKNQSESTEIIHIPLPSHIYGLSHYPHPITIHLLQLMKSTLTYIYIYIFFFYTDIFLITQST